MLTTGCAGLISRTRRARLTWWSRGEETATELVASLFFYAWGEKGYVLLMIGSIIVNYALGFLVESGRERSWGTAALAQRDNAQATRCRLSFSMCSCSS